MTGYGGAETDHGETNFNVEPNSVNRKQSDTVINRWSNEDSAKDARGKSLSRIYPAAEIRCRSNGQAFVVTVNAALPLFYRGFREPAARSAQFATSFADALPPHHICRVEPEAFQGCDGWRGAAVPT